jgi:hypothetical protein
MTSANSEWNNGGISFNIDTIRFDCILLILLQTKPITHAPQIFSQFASLTLNAPSTIAEILVSIEQIQARKVSF